MKIQKAPTDCRIIPYVCSSKKRLGLIQRKLRNMENTNDKNVIFPVPAVLPNGSGGFTCCPEVLTPREAALYLRLDLNGNWQQTLRYYREKKKLKATRIGKRLLYTRKALDEFLEKMTK